MPSHLSFEEAAALPRAAVTAWVALTSHRRVTAGDTVLTQDSGGASVFALQLARVLGARVITMTSTGAKAERLKGAQVSVRAKPRQTWKRRVLLTRALNGRQPRAKGDDLAVRSR